VLTQLLNAPSRAQACGQQSPGTATTPATAATAAAKSREIR